MTSKGVITSDARYVCVVADELLVSYHLRPALSHSKYNKEKQNLLIIIGQIHHCLFILNIDY